MSDIGRMPYSAASGKFYPLVLCFFVGSGLAALISKEENRNCNARP